MKTIRLSELENGEHIRLALDEDRFIEIRRYERDQIEVRGNDFLVVRPHHDNAIRITVETEA